MCDLEFIPTVDLIEELLKRTDHGIISLLKIKDNETTQVARRWIGNSHTCSGLCSDLSRSILIDYNNKSKRIDSL
ncbi:MAG: hypothetical protein ACFFG0_15300 [Candidatus Thorarchaeota archaeon]